MTTLSRPVHDRLRHLLVEAFAPTYLDIRDDSGKHAGHMGARPEGETHFRVTIVSEAFVGESRVARQRRVFAALEDLMETRVHALQLKALTPDEYADQ